MRSPTRARTAFADLGMGGDGNRHEPSLQLALHRQRGVEAKVWIPGQSAQDDAFERQRIPPDVLCRRVDAAAQRRSNHVDEGASGEGWSAGGSLIEDATGGKDIAAPVHWFPSGLLRRHVPGLAANPRAR